mmetsp:Transcript_4818/g.14138  ORF Transcript_4818/g.14138 Transcript_4818/m.14138 type:complete len:123 (-) Transcript_4818:17-385(-)
MAWGKEQVKDAAVTTLTSQAAWRELLASEQDRELTVLMVTFTFCRSCRAFEKTFREQAQARPNLRFVELVGNGTLGGMELATKELGVKASPAFFVYAKGGEQLAHWTGAGKAKFEANLAELA